MANSRVANASLLPQSSPVFRAPRRMTITVPYGTYQKLLDRSTLEGRSLSNLAAFLLESAISDRSTGD